MVLVLGGTTEGRLAAETLDAAGSLFFYSTKGSDQQIQLHNGQRVCGAMDFVSMCNFCKTNGIQAVVDAAHPFAEGLHDTVNRVCKELGIGLIRYERDFSTPYKEIIWCDSYADAIEQLKRDNITKLLALTGVNTIPKLKGYWCSANVDCFFRVLDRDESRSMSSKAGFPQHKLLFFNDELLHRGSSDNASSKISSSVSSSVPSNASLNASLNAPSSVSSSVSSSVPSKISNVVSEGVSEGIQEGGLKGESEGGQAGSPENFSAKVVQKEIECIRKILPQAIITKESGASGYFNEKVAAALRCGVKIYAVRRPLLKYSLPVVYGPVGLRLMIERLLPDFFPLRIGLTTGSTATAATKGAMLRLLYGADEKSVYITLPGGEKVFKELKGTGYISNKQAWGCAVKYSGDDPDITNGTDITVTVQLNRLGKVRFFGGEGVGRVTLPGLGIEVGGPAINKNPRKMMEAVVDEQLAAYKEFCHKNGIEYPQGCSADITISVAGGREIAAKTFNPKVGVVDGISIVGTSGVVRPFSKEAFLNSINREMDVAKALGVTHLVINSGAKSEQKIKESVGPLPSQAFIHYGNFIGDTIKMASEHGFERVTMGVMIGKAVKLAAGNLDTHSKTVTVDKGFVKQVARDSGCSNIPEDFTLARELWGIFKNDDAVRFFGRIKELCYSHCAPLLPNGKLEIMIIGE